MKVCPVYNLEFPSWCPEINIFGYRFTRVDDYQERFLSLQHLSTALSEFSEEPNTGMHAITAFVEIPDKEEKAILDWSGDNSTALMDVMLLLSIFTCRDIFILKPQSDKRIKISRDPIIADPRVFQWGGILRCSIPYKKFRIDPEPLSYDIGFEEGINQVYKLMRTVEWQKEYMRGYFLFLARMAFRRQMMESSFIICWTIWEHLFAILNSPWLSNKQIQIIGTAEKISFLLVKYALSGEIDSTSRKRIESLAEIRNRLVHFGKFTNRGSSHDDAILFVQLTEFIIAKILGLSPSNIMDTLENLENFLSNIEKQKG